MPYTFMTGSDFSFARRLAFRNENHVSCEDEKQRSCVMAGVDTYKSSLQKAMSIMHAI
jgi:hypothetical protein